MNQENFKKYIDKMCERTDITYPISLNIPSNIPGEELSPANPKYAVLKETKLFYDSTIDTYYLLPKEDVDNTIEKLDTLNTDKRWLEDSKGNNENLFVYNDQLVNMKEDKERVSNKSEGLEVIIGSLFLLVVLAGMMNLLLGILVFGIFVIGTIVLLSKTKEQREKVREADIQKLEEDKKLYKKFLEEKEQKEAEVKNILDSMPNYINFETPYLKSGYTIYPLEKEVKNEYRYKKSI